uniref:NADH-ubiquinone oxidoreductase chain 4 n=1 Tax=Clanoptilus assimilis TaxID=1205594 RepID=A0A0S2MRN9_9CUCU|nr:NADH deshydrogenase subunit 4 [Clanoptilus assimilis]
MMMIFFMLFMIPLFFLLSFWEVQLFFILLSLFFMIKINFSLIFINISYIFGYDLMSFMLILLSFWVCMLMMLASEKLFKLNFYFKMFMLVNMFLLLSLFLTFCSMDLFIFYLFFEISMIPVLVLILGWGYQPERLQAGMYMFFYTLFASLPMMIFIFIFMMIMIFLSFYFLKYLNMSNFLFYIFVNLVFFVKMPMYIVHLWLPKAHVEAPISGSMILAGVMLKLGGYGMMRMMVLFIEIGLKINYFLVILSLFGGMMISILCLYQSDMKSLIAYSSVAHMSLVIGGILSLSYWGFIGSMLMMLAHGLCSSGLFCLSNINYERLESRSIYLNKGLLNLLPSLSFWWFLFCACNMAAPPSLNLMSEIILLISIINFNYILIIFLIFLSFFSAVYSLFLFAFTQHGSLVMNLNIMIINIREYLLLLLHLLPLNIFILKSELLMMWL